MIYITGDLHGDISRFSAPAMRRLRKGDTLIVCGDFGFVWDGSAKEQKLLKKIGAKPYTVLFLDGCHENFQLLQEISRHRMERRRRRCSAAISST